MRLIDVISCKPDWPLAPNHEYTVGNTFIDPVTAVERGRDMFAAIFLEPERMKRNRLTSNGVRLILMLTAYCAGSFTLMSPVGWAGEFTMDEFHTLHRQLQVAADKPWRTIPWKTAILDAQESAARQSKPIFIWAMDGHPLGCT